MHIITGLGRCGTSILIKYLKELGFGIGVNINWHEVVRAGYELSTAYSINREMWNAYCKAGKPIDLDFEYRGPYWQGKYRDIILKVDKDEKQINPDGKGVEIIKDPRFTWSPELIEAWWEVRQDFKLIICHRDIQSVMDSRKALPPQYDDPKRIKLSEYKEDFADFFTKVLQLEIPYEILFFPKFLQDYESTYNTLNKIGLDFDFDDGKEIWDEMIDRSLLDGRT